MIFLLLLFLQFLRGQKLLLFIKYKVYKINYLDNKFYNKEINRLNNNNNLKNNKRKNKNNNNNNYKKNNNNNNNNKMQSHNQKGKYFLLNKLIILKEFLIKNMFLTNQFKH